MAVWQEPVRGGFASGMASRPGVERLRSLAAPDALQPPLFRLTGMRLAHVGPGTVTVSMPTSPLLLDLLHLVDIFMLGETAASLAGLTAASPGRDVRCAAITYHHHRPITLSTERLIARASVVHAGRSYTLVDFLVEDGVGRPVSRGMASLVSIEAVDGDLQPDGPEARWPTPDPWQRDLRVPPIEDIMAAVWRAVAEPEAPIGDQAPLHDQLGAEPVEASDRRYATRFRTSGWLADRPNRVSAGAIVSLTGWTMGGSTASAVPEGHRVTVVEHHVQFLRATSQHDGPLLCQARLTHEDGESLVAAAEVTDADGRVVAVAGFSTITRPYDHHVAPPAERRVATILFSDIVGSTEQARRLGDEAWRQRLATHHAVVRRQLGTFRGREVKTTGDGFLAVFESAARAVQCAKAIRAGLHAEGLEVRIGIHAGECEMSADDVSGLAVHAAARIEAQAGAGEILVSGTVRDLTAGSGLVFVDAGEHDLKGLDGSWSLFAAAE